MKRKMLTAMLVVLGLGSLAFGAYYTWLQTPPPMPENVDQAFEVLTSARYENLSEQQRERYLTRAFELTEALDEEGKKRMRDMWREKMKENPDLEEQTRLVREEFMYVQARKFATASESEQLLILERMIGAMEMARQRDVQRRAQGAAGGDGSGPREELTEEQKAQRAAEREKRRQEFTDYIHERLEHGNPQKQAYVAGFFKALMNRRAEMGLEPMPEPRRGRGGGERSPD